MAIAKHSNIEPSFPLSRCGTDMPKSSNPNSHRNKPTVVGSEKLIKMSQEYWDFAQIVGAGKINEGIREVVRAMTITASPRIKDVAALLESEDSVEAVKKALVEKFPDINSGRKNVDDLIQELMLGECRLVVVMGELIRLVAVATIDIRSPLDREKYLYEIRQEYPNKTVERGIRGVSEKIQGDEFASQAARRGIEEELGIKISLSEFIFLGEELVGNPTSAYFGITSNTHLYKFKASIEKSDYLPEYREVQEKKTTVFAWR